MDPNDLCLTGILIGLLMVSLPLSPLHAIQAEAGAQIRLEADRTLPGSYLAAGRTIDIEGRINGDLFCAAQTVNVRGTVAGDVICAGQYVRIEGTVQGDVRVVGQDVSVIRTIQQNLTTFGQFVNLTPGATVRGEVIGAASLMKVDGNVNGDVLAAADRISMGGRIGGNVILNAGSLSFGPDATIGGDLNYRSPEELPSSKLARVRGSTHYKPTTLPEPPQTEATRGWRGLWWVAGWLYSIVSFFLMGLLFLIVWPNGATVSVDAIVDRVGMSLVWGLVMLAVPPVGSLLLVVTIVGVPLAAVIMLLWVCLFLLSPVLAGLAAGDWVLNRIWKRRPFRLYGSLALGVAGLWILFAIPYLGWILYLFAVLLGMGGLFQSLRSLRRSGSRETGGVPA